jgi:archaellum component FlaC
LFLYDAINTVATVSEVLEKLVPGLISGASTAAATIYSYLSDIKKRLTNLESRIGSVDPDTGKASGLLGLVRQQRSEIEGLQEEVKNILVEVKALRKESDSSTRGGGFTSTDFSLLEDRISKNLKDTIDRQSKKIAQIEGKLDRCVTKESEASREAAISKISVETAEIKGSIQTLHSFMEKLMKLRLTMRMSFLK